MSAAFHRAIAVSKPNAHRTMWTWLALIYGLLIHVVLAVLLIKTDALAKVKEKIAVDKVISRARVMVMQRYYEWTDYSIPHQSVVFLGDSITHGIAADAVTPCAVNYGIQSARTDDLLKAIPSYKSLNHARAIFLAIGINDLGEQKQIGLNERFGEAIRLLPRDTPLIWSAMMPTGTKETGIDLMAIREGNEAIKSLCAKHARCTFVNTWPLFADANSQIFRKLYLDDGLHLSPDGYIVWQTALRSALRGVFSNGAPSSSCKA